jgi:hypothetical protein
MSEITFLGIVVSDWVMIAAVISGPIAAVQIQKFLESSKEAKERRLRVFKDLMATRASTLAYQHVAALNLVGLEFHGKEFSKVISAWNMYLDHLNSFPKDDEALGKMWIEKCNDLLSDLLYEMGLSLGFEFDKVHIKKAGYIPKGYADNENEQNYIRRSLIEVLDGNRPIPLNIVSIPGDPDAAAAQKELLLVLTKHYKEGLPFPVIIVSKNG